MKNLIFFFTLMPFLAYSQTIYHVSALNAKVYDLPNTGSSVLETLKKGEEIQFLKTMESGSWAKVQSKGKIGYMEVSTIAEGSKVEKKVKAAARAKYHVSVFQSTIYKAPKFSAPKVETLSQNKIIEVIGEAGEWGTVRTSSGIGYVNMAHLTKGMPEKVKKTKSVSTKYYTLKLDAKLLDKPNGTGKTLENLSIELGNLNLLTGLNGAGKSSLIQVLL
ncbi:MAG: SH3 domain-containing protein, partial [Bacteroidia bacterium]